MLVNNDAAVVGDTTTVVDPPRQAVQGRTVVTGTTLVEMAPDTVTVAVIPPGVRVVVFVFDTTTVTVVALADGTGTFALVEPDIVMLACRPTRPPARLIGARRGTALPRVRSAIMLEERRKPFMSAYTPEVTNDRGYSRTSETEDKLKD